MITQELVKELFEYRDGDLYWKKINPYAHNIKIGAEAGCLKNRGYLCTKINGKSYLNHRLIFLYHHGCLPKFIDHINNIKTDNRIENLREATVSQNALNKKQQSNNTSGIKGVSWNIQAQKWRVRLQINGKEKSFGAYYDFDAAKFIAETMRHKFHGEFANHGV